MDRRGKPPLEFEIDYLGETFSGEEGKSSFGFRPLDVFLIDEIDSDDILEPRLIFYGDSGEELVDNMEEKDLLLASRYILEDFDIEMCVVIHPSSSRFSYSDWHSDVRNMLEKA